LFPGFYVTGKPLNAHENPLKKLDIAKPKKLPHGTMIKSVLFNTVILTN
jgi:hypothetical protein